MCIRYIDRYSCGHDKVVKTVWCGKQDMAKIEAGQATDCGHTDDKMRERPECHDQRCCLNYVCSAFLQWAKQKQIGVTPGTSETLTGVSNIRTAMYGEHALHVRDHHMKTCGRDHGPIKMLREKSLLVAGLQDVEEFDAEKAEKGEIPWHW